MQFKINPPLLLASSSPWRAHLLKQAHLEFTVIPSPYDEEKEKQKT